MAPVETWSQIGSLLRNPLPVVRKYFGMLEVLKEYPEPRSSSGPADVLRVGRGDRLVGADGRRQCDGTARPGASGDSRAWWSRVRGRSPLRDRARPGRRFGGCGARVEETDEPPAGRRSGGASGCGHLSREPSGAGGPDLFSRRLRVRPARRTAPCAVRRGVPSRSRRGRLGQAARPVREARGPGRTRCPFGTPGK